MFQSRGLMPHAHEPAVVTAVKKIPVVGSARRATMILYIASVLLFLLSFLILYSVNKAPDQQEKNIPPTLEGKL
jgi:hypothetical protein